MTKIQGKLLEEVNKEIKVIQDFLNIDLLTQYNKFHNIPQNESILKLKNEFLMDKRYSLDAKKKYVSRVIAQEGVPCLKIDIKGLESRRSEIPKISKELINNIIDKLLSDDGVTIAEIFSYVDKVRKQVEKLATEGNPSISKRVVFTKEVKDYKRTIPQHVKAMLMWNEIMHNSFFVGSRGGLFFLKSIDLNHLKIPRYVRENYHNKFLKKYKISDLDCIALPEEEKKLPLYFNIDIKKTVEYVVNSRMDLLLSPLASKREDILEW